MKVCTGDSDLTLPLPIALPLLRHLLYISSLVSPAKFPSLPHVERLQLQMHPTVLHEIVAYVWTLSKRPAFPEVRRKPTWWALSPSFPFSLSLSVSLPCTPCPTPRKRFEVRKVSERLKLLKPTGWTRGRRTRIARTTRRNAGGIVINARIPSR